MKTHYDTKFHNNKNSLFFHASHSNPLNGEISQFSLNTFRIQLQKSGEEKKLTAERKLILLGHIDNTEFMQMGRFCDSNLFVKSQRLCKPAACTVPCHMRLDLQFTHRY